MLWDDCYMQIKQKWIETCGFEWDTCLWSRAKLFTAWLVWWSQSRWRAAGFLWSSARDASGTRRTSNTNISCSSHRWTSPTGWRRGSSKSYRDWICSCRDCICLNVPVHAALYWTELKLTRLERETGRSDFFQIFMQLKTTSLFPQNFICL